MPPGVVRPTAREAARLPTAGDVARAAGVSQSAVSRSFTPGASVAAATRERVLAAAEALNYQPNLLARTLTTGRSYLIGVAVGDLANPFYPEMLRHLAAQLAAAGRQVVLLGAGGGAAPCLDHALRYRLGGLVLASTQLSPDLAQECRRAGIPVVLLNRVAPGASTVSCDNRNGARQVARFLLAGDYRRPAFVAGLETSPTSRERERGFRGELARAGVPLARREVGGVTAEEAWAAAERLFEAGEPPDAVFCASDLLALALMDAARHRFGLHVPEDLGIVGFDDAPQAAWPGFVLTTYRQPVAAMAEAAVALLMAGGAPRRVVLPGQLVVRASARRPKRWMEETTVAVRGL